MALISLSLSLQASIDALAFLLELAVFELPPVEAEVGELDVELALLLPPPHAAITSASASAKLPNRARCILVLPRRSLPRLGGLRTVAAGVRSARDDEGRPRE